MNHPTITLYTLVRGITVIPRTHFGSRPNRTPRGTSVLARTEHPIFRAHNSVLARRDTSVLARTEHPEALRFSPEPNTQRCPQGSQESGLAPGNSLLDYPLSLRVFGQYGPGCPARTGVPYGSEVSPPRLVL